MFPTGYDHLITKTIYLSKVYSLCPKNIPTQLSIQTIFKRYSLTQRYLTLRYLKVFGHGSPYTPLEATNVQEDPPLQLAFTISADLAASHDVVWMET